MSHKLSNPYENLFASLDRNNVEWCSWKSNLHILAGVEGKTDTDLLITTHNAYTVDRIMQKNGFVKFYAPFYRSYPQIYDYVAIHPSTGRSLHAHTHFKLTLGEKNLKGYVLPWSDEIQNRREFIRDGGQVKFPYYASNPLDELFLLYVREALKIRMRERIFKNKQKQYGDNNTLQEREDLLLKTNSEEFYDHCVKMIGEDGTHIIMRLHCEEFNINNLLDLRQFLIEKAEVEEWRRVPPIQALFNIWFREGLAVATTVSDKLNIKIPFIIRRRTMSGQGMVIAFTGVDGSGKSSVTKTIRKLWAPKMDIVSVYFGTGDGKKSILMKALAGANKLSKKILGKQSANVVYSGTVKQQKDEDVSWKFIIWAALNARYKLRLMKKVASAKRQGKIVIADRWPQNQVNGINDGPLLGEYRESKHKAKRFLASWEKNMFEKICSYCAPDLAFHLDTTIEDSLARKAEHVEIRNTIERKIQAFKDIQLPAESVGVKISTSQSLNHVLGQVFEHVHTYMSARSAVEERFYECFGLPGSGKTTISNEVHKTTKFKSSDEIVFKYSGVIRLLSNLYYLFQSLPTEINAYVQVMRTLIIYNRKAGLSSAKYLLKLPAQKRKYTVAAKKSYYFADQLLLQNIWSYFCMVQAKDVRIEDISPLINAIYGGFRPTIVYVQTDEQDTLKRLQGRTHGKSRFEVTGQNDISHKLHNALGVAQKLIKASQYAGMNVVTIHGEGSLGDVLEDLREKTGVNVSLKK